MKNAGQESFSDITSRHSSKSPVWRESVERMKFFDPKDNSSSRNLVSPLDADKKAYCS
jgi:hypothetical protein